MGWIDTHCHLNDDRYKDNINEILQHAKEADVEHMIVVGSDMETSRRAVSLAQQHNMLSAVIGIHPSDADTFDVYTIDKLSKLLLDESVVAIGEIGLDYYWADNPAHDLQKEVFRKQLQLAIDHDVPVVIHMRDATQDTYNILKEFPGIQGVMHCYSGSYEMAKEFIKLGLYISLAGPVTFKNAVAPKEVATKLPLDSLLIETDSPYLTPHPFRGKQNEPAMVQYVGNEIAELRSMEIEELKRALRDNTSRLFHVKLDK